VGTLRRLRRFGVTAAAASACLSLGACAREAGGVSFELLAIGVLDVETALDPRPVGGLSGLGYRDGRWFAVSDDAASPRVYELRIEVDAADGTLAASVVGVTDLPGNYRDAEGLAALGDDAWLISYEAPPAVVRTDGAFENPRAMRIPAHISTHARPNLSFESVTARPSPGGGVEVWAAVEEPLRSDGERASTTRGGLCRVVVFDAAMGEAVREHVYETLPAPPGLALPGALAPRNGLVALEALEDGRILSLERGAAAPSGFRIAIRVIEPGAGESDVLGAPSLRDLAPDDARPLRVRTITTLGDLGAPNVGNIEGMAIGPRIGDARAGRLLVLIADDNFGRDVQRGSAIVALRLVVDGAE